MRYGMGLVVVNTCMKISLYLILTKLKFSMGREGLVSILWQSCEHRLSQMYMSVSITCVPVCDKYPSTVSHKMDHCSRNISVTTHIVMDLSCTIWNGCASSKKDKTVSPEKNHWREMKWVSSMSSSMRYMKRKGFTTDTRNKFGIE